MTHGAEGQSPLTHPERTRVIGYGVIVLAVSVLLGALYWPPEAELEYTVQCAVRDDDYVQAEPDRPGVITFPDRTRIQMLAGTRLRIAEPARHPGVRITLERGRLEVDVTHTAHASWQFAAGPFEFGVTGTRFTLSWEAEREQLELVLHEGIVDVQGYEGSAPLSVHAGQRLLGDTKQRTMHVSDVAIAR